LGLSDDHPDFEEESISCGANDDSNVVVGDYTDRIAVGVEDVVVNDVVSAC
jgi:hypothetical protein